MKQKIVFFGSGYYTIPIIESLLRQNLAIVVTTEKKGKLVDYLKIQNIPFVISDLKSKSDIEKNRESNPTLGVLVSYSALVPAEIIKLFKHGILNIHPSLLPKYKGPSPIQYTIKNGDRISGVTIIKLDSEIDHGPIVAQEKIELKGDETQESLTESLFKLGSQMITSIVRELNKGQQIEAIAQDHSKEIFTKKISKKDGQIDIDNPPDITALNRLIRAYHPWPGVWFGADLNGQKRFVKLLPKNKIQVEGKNAMSYKDFMNGFGQMGRQILEKLSFT